jgi:KipI family sensor histidine kinase inhibitor
VTDAIGEAVLRPCGEDAFVVEFGETIDAAVGTRVGALAEAMDAAAPPGIVEVVPTFRSLLVVYDPEVTSQEAILAALPPAGERAAEPRAHWRVPVCLEGAAAEDLAEAAEGLSLSVEAVRERFLASTFQVGMYGFAPGFAYLSGLDAALAIPRRAQPRPPMPPGSVIIAGGMAALNSAALPTGWYVIGATGLTLFRPGHDPMVPFAVGDRLSFHRVSEAEIARLAAREDGGMERTAP